MCSFCEQEGHLAAPYPLRYFIFKGSLVDPRLRASNELNAPSKLARYLSVMGADGSSTARNLLTRPPTGTPRRPLARARGVRDRALRELNAIAHRLNTRPRNASTSPRPWKSMRNCAIVHPLHLELETTL